MTVTWLDMILSDATDDGTGIILVPPPKYFPILP